jgi:hypothetical protein
MILMGYEPRAEVSEAPTSVPVLEQQRDIWMRARDDAQKFMRHVTLR